MPHLTVRWSVTCLRRTFIRCLLMPDRLPVSVFIIARDEADRIGHAIASVIDWVDQVIVIDNGSTDDTVAVAESLGATVLHHDWQGYGPQKIFGQSQCRNDWLLNIDADEAISDELATEIRAMFADGSQPPLKAYRLNIRALGRFQTAPGRFAPSNSPIRLYHRQYAGFKASSVHDSVVFNPETPPAQQQVGRCRGIVIHRCFRSYRHAVEKINFYTSMLAEDMVRAGRRPTALRVIITPLAAFLKAYFPRRYFLLGIDGFVESIIYAFGRTLRLAKARERWHELQKQKHHDTDDYDA